MEIRKLFKVEMSHVVRNCSTDRCRKSNHGHSAVIEVFLKSSKLDNAGMICDFSLVKKNIGQFIDSFDHCDVLWTRDNLDYLNDMKKWSDRWIETSFNPSAECLALYFCTMINNILVRTDFNNGEGDIICSKVIYHETTTGYAEATFEDIGNFNINLQTQFSKGVKKDWSKEMKEFIKDLNDFNLQKRIYFTNNEPEKQVEL